MAAKKKSFDAEFDLASHILSVQNLGKALLRQAALALGATDPDDLSTISANCLDPDSLKSCNSIFSSASQQITALTKVYQMVAQQNRDQIRERVLIDTLRAVDPQLAAVFLEKYEEALGKSELESGE